MLFTTLLISAFSLLVSAQSGANPIVPIEGSINAGQPLTIKWQPNTQGTVSLTLRWGAAQNLEKGTPIACKFPCPFQIDLSFRIAWDPGMNRLGRV
jgi:hypothetical protein